MKLHWVDGQVWIQTDFYEGPHDLLLTFAQRAQIRWEDICLEELFSAMLAILPALPLEERIEVLLFVSHLMRLKAFSLLPTPNQSEETPETPPTFSKADSFWEKVSHVWEPLIQESLYRLSRSAEKPPETAEPVILGLTPMRLFRTYEEMVRRYHRRQAVHRPTPLPFTPEEVETHLVRIFEHKPTQLLSHLWSQLLPHPIYKALAFLMILVWIQEGTLSLTLKSPWDVELSWQRSVC
ncbi:MAG: hypothetical protein N3E49_05110 [Bacteroidia bacterium]|nr:hypothetical protein [Bacteroidia bacterium]